MFSLLKPQVPIIISQKVYNMISIKAKAHIRKVDVLQFSDGAHSVVGRSINDNVISPSSALSTGKTFTLFEACLLYSSLSTFCVNNKGLD